MMSTTSRGGERCRLWPMLVLLNLALPWGPWSCTAAPTPDSSVATITVTYDNILAFARGGGYDYRRAHAVLAEAASDAGRAVRFKVDWPMDTVPTDPAQARDFWIDAYNGSAIVGVLNHYPCSSVTDIPGYFTERRYDFFGERLSLDDMEKQKLQGKIPDARIHFAIVCASVGCPPLYGHPFQTAFGSDSLLERLTRQTINDTNYVRLDMLSGTARLSRLFDWYRSDFEAAAGTLWDFIARYHERTDEIVRRSWTVQYRDYDWSLNQVPAPSR